jgi:hypothetical protein
MLTQIEAHRGAVRIETRYYGGRRRSKTLYGWLTYHADGTATFDGSYRLYPTGPDAPVRRHGPRAEVEAFLGFARTITDEERAALVAANRAGEESP